MDDKFVLASPALDHAVRQRNSARYPDKPKANSSLKEPWESPGGYDGFFAVLFDGKTFSVVDGGDPESGNAGYCWVDGTSRSVSSASGVQPKEGFLCIKAYHIGQDCTFEIVDQFPSKPEKIGDPDYHPLAIVKKVGEQWTFRQISKWELPQLWIFADCGNGNTAEGGRN